MSQSISPQQVNAIVSQALEAAVRYFPVMLQRYFQDNPPTPRIAGVDVDERGGVKLRLSDGSKLDLGPLRGLMGPQGARGLQGVRGPRGQRGARGDGVTSISEQAGVMTVQYGDGAIVEIPMPVGPPGPQGLAGVSISEIHRVNDELTVGLDNGKAFNVGKLPRGDSGAVGATGERGATGQQGIAGPRGEPGLQGVPGAQGISVVELLVRDDGTGNAHFWSRFSDGGDLDSGPVPRGLPGETGTGIADIQDKSDGTVDVTLTDGRRIKIELPRGETGRQGPQGRGIAGLRVDGGDLLVTYDDSTDTINLGRVSGKDGETPELAKQVLNEQAVGMIADLVNRGIYHLHQDTQAALDLDGNLNIRIAGTLFKLGNVRGADGANGKDGKDGIPGEPGTAGAPGDRGSPGIGISDMRSDGSFIVVTKSDGGSHRLGPFFSETPNPIPQTQRRKRT